jgi:LytS/YehU family sensor histidine kinase
LLREKIQLEKSLSKSILTSIKAQMNPHFFYNALNTIQAYIFTNDNRNASSYLAKFSKLTRMILEMSGKEKISLSEEIIALKLYLELEQVRFNDDFEFLIEVDQGIDPEMIKLPSMLIQPYVENSIKHGLLHKKGIKKVVISFLYQDGILKITIDDNGIGRKRSAELNKIRDEVYESFSTDANQKRLEILNRDSNSKISVSYFDKADDYQNSLGTTVVAYIPINK